MTIEEARDILEDAIERGVTLTVDHVQPIKEQKVVFNVINNRSVGINTEKINQAAKVLYGKGNILIIDDYGTVVGLV